MNNAFNLVISVIVIFLGIPLGNFLAKQTKEELISGQKWFKLIIILSIIGAIVGLAIRNDALLFVFAFIAVVTSRSLKARDKKKR